MNIRPIRNRQDYEAALQRASRYCDNPPPPDTPQGDEFEILITLLDVYESQHFPLPRPDAVDAIRFRMEQGGLGIEDLVSSIGQPECVQDILARKRQLTLPMIRCLHRNLGISLETLVGA